MHIYMAAIYTNGYRAGGTETGRYAKLTTIEKKYVDNVQNLLESYHYVYKDRIVAAMRNDGVKVFLDSGAFSAWSLGVNINISDYCEYIQRNLDILRVEDGALMASVLDGIGDPLQTWRNQLEMEARGVRPLPCFHYGEDERFLEYYIKNYDYITIGGMVGRSSVALKTWLDRIWSRYLITGSGEAKIKVHAFGITSIPIMKEYPWYSVDSSSWIQSAAFGGIITPQWGSLQISSKSPSRHKKNHHISTLTDIEKDTVLQYLEKNGFTYERLSEVYESRAAFNLWTFTVINTILNAEKDNVFRAKIQELF